MAGYLIWGAMLVPLFTMVILLVFFKRRMLWWELLIPVGVSLVLILVCKLTVQAILLDDTEYWGGWVTEAWYYEGWNEYHHQTCTRTVDDGDGKSHTETYDCSYVEDHAPYWEVHTTIGTITMETGGTWGLSWTRETFPGFEALSQRWGNRQFVEMHHSYHTKDGDAYVAFWPKSEETLEPVTRKNTYKNKVKVANSVFSFPEVSKAEVKQYGLFDYPPIVGGYSQQQILGNGGPSQPAGERRLQIMNAELGAAKKVRMYVLIFQNQPIEASVKQEALWRGGNQNEFVLCIGVNDQYKATWARAFSWTDVERLKVDARVYIGQTFINAGRPLDLVAVANWLGQNVERQFVKKNWHDFDYLTVEPPLWGLILTYTLTILVNGGLSTWLVLNQHNEDGSSTRFRIPFSFGLSRVFRRW